jgi:menaquinol-cytochrome c reductase iron-sulfur subunit
MAQPTQKPASAPKPPAPLTAPTTARRGFLTCALAIVCGALAMLVPTLAGLAVFFDPLRRKNRQTKMIRVATLDALPDDGIPREFPVITERVDAWNRSREPIGAVYLRRNQGQEKIECWTATCPHAGCFVDFDEETNTFKCPCHNSQFSVEGAIIAPSPSPRPMDTLECKVSQEEILVNFENFYTGKSEKVAKA